MSAPLKIVVLVKHVPDPSAERSFAADHTTDRVDVGGMLSELDEYAVEQALRVVEGGSVGEITYLTMGPSEARDALRKALSMGGDRAIHVVDDALHGSDAPTTSLVLARAIEQAGFDLVVCGMASTDGEMSVIPAMLAERLGVAQLTFAGELKVSGDTVRIRRDSDTAAEDVEAALPAVVAVTDQTGEARYPSFKGIMSAKKKPLETRSLADLGIEPGEVGLAGSWTAVEQVSKRPPRQKGTVVRDDGDGARMLVDFLEANKFV